MSGEQTITVTGTVPELRVVVIDQTDTIRLITSNTPAAVAPKVVLLTPDGPEVAMSDRVRAQYNSLMAQMRGRKIGSMVPAPVPLAQLMPEFAPVRATPTTAYQVFPTASAADPAPQSYGINAATD
jgi:hypothetical protein